MSFIQERVFKYLCPPGNGVHTVHTAKEHKEKLHNKLYNTAELEKVKKAWEESFSSLQSDTTPCLLGVTLDTGGGIQRGANWGPLFLRSEILKYAGQGFFDLGDIKTIPHLLHDKYLNTETIKSCQNALYQTENDLPVSGLSIAEDFCNNFYKNFPDKKILGLGGDHSVSYALVKPWINARRALGKKVAIIHFDAHTDLMPHRLGIDVCFASWAYHMIELLEQPSDLIQLGIRSSGQEKAHWEETLGVQQYWAQEFTEQEKIQKQIINYLKDREIDELYISFDIDALDAKYASATGTPETDGLEPHQCVQVINALKEHCKITGADLVEVAPFVKSSLASPLAPEPDATLLSSKIILETFLEALK
jgi:agmatinase